MHTREQILQIAKTWVGVPYLLLGRNRAGVDCGGLLIAIGEEAGANIIHPDSYSNSPDPKLVLDAILANAIKTDKTDLRPGNILHFSFAGEPRHVGLCTSIGVIHSWAKPKKVVEHSLDKVWMSRLVGVYIPKIYME